MSFKLPRFVVLSSDYHGSSNGNFYYRESDGSVVLGEPSVFSTLVKIEVEPAKSNERYVHLRFSHSNRYWQRKENDTLIVCVSTKPEEDTSNPSCTLFEPVVVAGTDGKLFYLNHVQSAGHLLVDNLTMSFYVSSTPGVTQGYLSFVDWETLVKLPEHVAFKGFNNKFLEGVLADGKHFLKFVSDDPNTRSSGHQVFLMDDGNVRIRSDLFGQFWRKETDWVLADTDDTMASDEDILFWPVKIDSDTIALRNAGSKTFCQRYTNAQRFNFLNAMVATITMEARLVVQELVLDRRIYDVRYRMQDARIFDETPYIAGFATLINEEDVAAPVAVTFAYLDESSYSFSRSLSLTSGVYTTISSGLAKIAGESIEISSEVNSELEWGRTIDCRTSVTATGLVLVPAKSSALVTYVGTKGTCNIPFYYTQQDRSSTDGTVMVSDWVDGIYTGVNCYNFHFVVDKTEHLP